MRRVLVVGLLLVLAGLSPARADGLSTDDQTTIQKVITAQLDAFNHDDGSRAYSFAAPGIKVMFPSVDNFMAMVREGYPPVYRSREAEFRDVVALDGGLARQQVLIVGADGTVVLALYTMERGADGIWLIAGCTLVKADEAGA